MNHVIVGVGASAGGMEALHDLFDYMPVNTGFSFVIIQHLSPDYKSLMAELLSRHTKMQVWEAKDGMKIELNCIYAIPSRKVMTIKDGILQVIEKQKSKLPNDAIDVFFESLAMDRKKDAVGIILSGTGTDGTRGIEAIKRNGGIVIVQEPMSAAFDGMPNSAVATGLADLIVPPEMIGEELVGYLRQAPLVRSMMTNSEKNEALLQSIIEHLKKSTAFDFSNYKRPTLYRRLANRMAMVGVDTISDYHELLKQSDDELNILSKEFLINVTKFFRDSEAFDSIRTEAIPAIVTNRKPEEPIKIWVVACSSGEEAYSIGMLFLEYFEKAGLATNHLKIFATDIDSDALETASRGVYNENISKDVPPDLLLKYFLREGNTYRVLPELRKHIVFANHDILKDPPFSHLSLITCRNMFIYMSAVLQQKILRKFHFALKIDSFLMLGPSENISILKDATEEVNRKWKLYRCVNKAGLTEQGSFMMPLESGRMYSPINKQNSKNVANHLSEIFRDTLLEDRKMAAMFIDKDFNVKQAIGSYKDFLTFPEETFNFNLIKLLSGDLAVAIGVGVRKALAQSEKVSLRNVIVHEETSTKKVNIIIKPFLRQQEFQQAFLCVIIEDQEISEPKTIASTGNLLTENGHDRLVALEQELTNTRENLQAVIEEMETANEELQSTNEEMISTNEELQSTNEELQSLNEELHTVSGEHQLKIKELLELNDDLNNYFTNSHIGQILVDKDLLIRKFSPAVKQMVNLIETDIGRSIEDITTKLNDIDLVDSIRKVMKSTAPFEKEFSEPNGKYFLLRISPYLRRDKTIDGVVINFTDISEATRLHSIIQSIFNSSVNGITAKRAIRNEANEIVDFEYLALNHAAHSMFGLKNVTMEGKKMLQLFPGKASHYFKIYADVVETGQSRSFDFLNTTDDKWYNVSVVKMLDGVVTTHTDITEKRKSDDLIAKNFEDLKATSNQLKVSNIQLERSNFDLLQFASIASHDLKEPLRKIQAFGNILLDKIQSKLSGNERNYFLKIISSSERMQKLIEDVLSLSKLSNSALVKEKINLVDVVNSIVDDLEISITEKNARISIGKLPVINAVPGQMRQLFQNLISNALKFRDKEIESPQITIGQKEIPEDTARSLQMSAGHFVCISIQDNGIGFEDEYREKIFGIFQRLHGRNYEGTGIGLAIARKIVENHGGYITATGKINEGAEFLVFLPIISEYMVNQ